MPAVEIVQFISALNYLGLWAPAMSFALREEQVPLEL